MYILKELSKNKETICLKKRNRREARQYAFQVLYANEFHTSNDDVIFPDGEISLSMDIAYATK